MYIVVKHEIRDAKSFFDKGATMVQSLPEGVHAHLFLPDKAMTSAVCLWEADSVGTVKSVVEKELGRFSRNDYYELDGAKASGLERLGLATTR